MSAIEMYEICFKLSQNCKLKKPSKLFSKTNTCLVTTHSYTDMDILLLTVIYCVRSWPSIERVLLCFPCKSFGICLSRIVFFFSFGKISSFILSFEEMKNCWFRFTFILHLFMKLKINKMFLWSNVYFYSSTYLEHGLPVAIDFNCSIIAAILSDETTRGCLLIIRISVICHCHWLCNYW